MRAITDTTGAKVESAIYRPFGEQSEWLLPGTPAPETKGRTRDRYDADAGLQYLNARYYDPALGLFLQPDWFEVTKPGVGTNRFSYSFNDPVNRLDPGGNAWYNDWGDFKDLFRGSETTDSDGRVEIKSTPILRAIVPGQVAWDNARSAWANEDYANAAIYSTGMVGEAFATVATFGTGSTALGAKTVLTEGADVASIRLADEVASEVSEQALKTTAHGAERIAGEAATRGGVLTAERAAEVMSKGRVLTQTDGAVVTVLENAGRFDVVVYGERGVATTFENLSQKSLDRLTKNYGWQ